MIDDILAALRNGADDDTLHTAISTLPVGVKGTHTGKPDHNHFLLKHLREQLADEALYSRLSTAIEGWHTFSRAVV